jgi:hypothetical protein
LRGAHSLKLSGVDAVTLIVFFATMVAVVLPIWPLQILRGRGFREPFLVYIAFLWFLSFFIGGLNFSTSITIGEVAYKFRLSSGVYTVIFAALLFVYIAEGINEARKVIMISIGCQLLLILTQVFLYNTKACTCRPATGRSQTRCSNRGCST